MSLLWCGFRHSTEILHGGANQVYSQYYNDGNVSTRWSSSNLSNAKIERPAQPMRQPRWGEPFKSWGGKCVGVLLVLWPALTCWPCSTHLRASSAIILEHIWRPRESTRCSVGEGSIEVLVRGGSGVRVDYLRNRQYYSAGNVSTCVGASNIKMEKWVASLAHEVGWVRENFSPREGWGKGWTTFKVSPWESVREQHFCENCNSAGVQFRMKATLFRLQTNWIRLARRA
jgi:hypothetical protein